MRMLRPDLLALAAAIFLLLPPRLNSQQPPCPQPAPTNGSTPDFEKAAQEAFKTANYDANGCMKAGDPTCSQEKQALSDLEAAALAAGSHNSYCASTVTSETDKQWYIQRALSWNNLAQAIQQNATAAQNGTYKLSDNFKNIILNVPIPPSPPTIASKIAEGVTKVDVIVNPPPPPGQQFHIYACIWTSKPQQDPLDCSKKPASLASANNFVSTPNKGTPSSYSLTLKSGLQQGNYISITQDDSNDKLIITSKSATLVPIPKQCNYDPVNTPYVDCDTKFSLIGGVEQSDQASLPSETTPFVRVFTRVGAAGRVGSSTDDHLNIWAQVRLLGTPQASSTNNVVSAVSNPTGSITTQSLSGVGNSVDYTVGAEYMFHKLSQPYSVSIIAGFGGTTPLPANTLVEAFNAPAYGTVECSTIQARFKNYFSEDDILAGTSTNTNASSPSCLVNGHSGSTTSTGVTVYAPINTIAFSNQDRSSFLGKYEIGIRTIDRFRGSGDTACGDSDPTKQIGPCERGIVDFAFGQDESVTGGRWHNSVFRVDAVHPLPVPSVSFLYLFGSVVVRLAPSVNPPPLVLQAGNLSSLAANGTNPVPNVNVVVLPLTQPNRDFYRFGAGINLTSIFTKLSNASASKTASNAAAASRTSE